MTNPEPEATGPSAGELRDNFAKKYFAIMTVVSQHDERWLASPQVDWAWSNATPLREAGSPRALSDAHLRSLLRNPTVAQASLIAVFSAWPLAA